MFPMFGWGFITTQHAFLFQIIFPDWMKSHCNVMFPRSGAIPGNLGNNSPSLDVRRHGSSELAVINTSMEVYRWIPIIAADCSFTFQGILFVNIENNKKLYPLNFFKTIFLRWLEGDKMYYVRDQEYNFVVFYPDTGSICRNIQNRFLLFQYGQNRTTLHKL